MIFDWGNLLLEIDINSKLNYLCNYSILAFDQFAPLNISSKYKQMATKLLKIFCTLSSSSPIRPSALNPQSSTFNDTDFYISDTTPQALLEIVLAIKSNAMGTDGI